MPTIELNVSPQVARKWRRFLGTQSAGRLIEADLLGDWTLTAFMAEVERYLKEGLPQGQEKESRQVRESQASQARRRLSKNQKRILNMFNENENQTIAEISRTLAIDSQEVEQLIEQWVAGSFLAPGPVRDGQATYVLSPDWQKHNLAANRPSLNAPRLPHLWEQYKDKN